MSDHSVTYSPEDDKLRIYPAYRLPRDEYDQLKAAGFSWAPKQECFYAVWTPHREDVALLFADEIGDEDKSLVDRAEERADRFSDYSDNRRRDYEQAKGAVAAIADNIPFGQPILVGHHSEKHARKHAEKIENGMRRAVKMWETADYWKSRAAGALAHAKYKERPDVRHRRIKGLESDRRKQEKYKAEAEKLLKGWSHEPLTFELALQIANFDHGSYRFPLADYPRNPPASQYEGDMGLWSALDGGVITPEQAAALAIPRKHRTIAHCDRWIAHLDNRLLYERAMLAEAGGTAADKFDIQVGGRVLVRGEWVTVLKVNKVGGVVSSVTTNRRYVPKVGIEEVRDYQVPSAEDAEKVKAATKLPPICNYPGEVVLARFVGGEEEKLRAIVEITQAEWDRCHQDYKATRTVVGTETAGRHRVRIMVRSGIFTPVFITDAKRKDPPPPDAGERPVVPAPERAASQPVYRELPVANPEVDALKAALKGGVQVIAAPQLFPTPPEIAERMVDYLDLAPGMTVLEPSAGTGNLLQAIMNDNKAGAVVAVEINQALADRLKMEYPLTHVHCLDFLEYERGNYPVDRIIMNPPFEKGVDIRHIRHAFEMLKPGGRLVALCANGPRQREAFMAEAEHWEDLPAGSFAQQGTGVNVALMVLVKGGGDHA
jgi:protein-L-isoaspartate O-methyltransferase